MKTKIILITYVILASFQLGWHWFLGSHWKLADVFLRCYLYRFPGTSKGIAGFIDVLASAILLGLVIGYVAGDWSFQKRFWCVVLVGIGIVALLPLYAALIGKELVWWWPQNRGELVMSFVFELIKAWVIIGVFQSRQWLRGQQN